MIRNNKVLAAILVATLGINFVSAEMVDLASGDFDVVENTATQQDKEDIIKILQDELGTATEPESHQQPEGSGGFSQAFAYLTPMKDFGYMYATIDLTNNGKGDKVVHSDALGNSWGTSSRYNTYWGNVPLFKEANKYFTDTIKNTVNIQDSQLKNAFKQKTKDGKREFIASTLYVRWSYDLRWYNNNEMSYTSEINTRSGSHTAYVPIKVPDANGGGPYFSVGEWMEYDPGIMDDLVASGYNGKSNAARDKIRNESSARHISYRNLLGATPPKNVPYIDCDMGMTGDDWAARNKNGVFEKHAEVRRYINPGANNPKFEAVIPVKTTSINERVVTPNVAPKVSIEGDINYSEGEAVEYVFDIEMQTKMPSYTYDEDKHTYVFKRNVSGVLESYDIKEPRDKQIDVWHSDLKPTLEIRDVNGILACTPIPLQNIKNQRVVVKASDIGYVDISGGEATVNVGFNSNVRYLNLVADYDKKYKHSASGTLGSLSDLKEYIKIQVDNGGGYKQSLYTNIEKDYVASNPRLEKTFVTSRHVGKDISASTSIWIIPPDGDSGKPDVIVDVDPPNALTKVEGGSFDVNVNIDYKSKDPSLTADGDKEYVIKNEHELPPGEVGEHLWLDDFKIDSISVKAEDGSVIFKEEYGKSFEITEDTPGKIAAIIRDLEAAPSQVGEATVEIKYSYNRYHRKWQKNPSAEYELVGGVVVPNHWTVKASTIKTPQSGVATGNFNIYSLTGITG